MLQHLSEMRPEQRTVLVTGGAGYVGAALVPQMLAQGYRVRVLDLYIYGEEVLDSVATHPGLTQIKGDLRDVALLKSSLAGCTDVIHLACISNDPSFELNPELGKSINYDAFEPLVSLSKAAGVRRFIYASSSSVYGVKDEPNVTEEMTLEPLTDYSKFKALCEEILPRYQSPEFTTVTIRPATVCGYSPRQRLDVIVNIMTNNAVNARQVKIIGGAQKRPNIHIQDMVDAYLLLLTAPAERIAGEIFNCGDDNRTVEELAMMVRDIVGPEQVAVVRTTTDDNRSYHISSAKIKAQLGFQFRHPIEEAVTDLRDAFAAGKLPDPLNNPRYFNIKMMQQIHLA